MATVIFYEKPGCINNTKQKKLLREAGHDVDARNLLTETWSRESLSPFLERAACENWINRSHPGLKSGELKLRIANPDSVLDALCADPLLIRRPLMQISGEHYQGFDADMLDQLIGLSRVPEEDLESCPRTHSQQACS